MATYSQLHRSNSKAFGGRSVGDSLPTGCCNYRDLSNGISAPKCGCTRFWLNIQQQAEAKEWCFCGHHACFHETFSQLPRDSELFQQSYQTHEPPQLLLPLNDSPTRRQPRVIQPRPCVNGLGIQSHSQPRPPPTQSINTRVWDALTAYARDQEDGVPSVVSSKLPSTRTPNIAEDPTVLNTNRRPICPSVEIPSNTLGATHSGPDQYSATEIATPSVAGTPDLRIANLTNTQYRESPSNIRPSNLICGRQSAQVGKADRPPSETHLLPPNLIPRAVGSPSNQPNVEIQEFMRSYSRRLELLENRSFSQLPAEDLHDKLECFEGRLLEMEHWKAEQDQRETSPVPRKSLEQARNRRRYSPVTKSVTSDTSFDSDAAAYTEAAVLATLAANAESVPRIEALESRVSELEQAALPSYVRPWRIQVVVLPWGSDLRGIWFSSIESTQSSLNLATPVEQEWQPAATTTKSSFSSSTGAAWTTDSIQAWANETEDWLSPKACGPHGTVFQRLASRGLVQELMITGSDANHILGTIRDAFEDILWPDGYSMSLARGPYHGLRQPFVPLRKIRKSARLRFLSQAEMVTPAAWSASFLDSSVVMRVGEGVRRLYVTTPGAYLQSSSEAWSWKLIRDLPLYDASGDEMSAQAQGVAIESCWSYQQRLDTPRSARSSFASATSPWVDRTQDYAMEDPADSEGDRSPPSPRSNMHYTHRRTASLETFESSTKVSAAKRRVVSLESSQAQQKDVHGLAISKKRRITASPEAERRGVGLTPRWSREPLSPYASEAAPEQRGDGASNRRRPTTPFAYATPHSNNIGTMDPLLGDGDTEADSEDLDMAHSARGEDEWQGVDEGSEHSPQAPATSTSNGTGSFRV